MKDEFWFLACVGWYEGYYNKKVIIYNTTTNNKEDEVCTMRLIRK